MANIKDLIKSIEAADSSFDEKLAAINQMEETLVSMRAQEEQAVQDNVDLIVEAIKVMERKVENQLEIAKSIVPEKGDKGDKGDRGLDGANGRDGKDGRDGINGRDGQDGQDGVSVTDAKIDFDGSLIITLSTGQEINVGEVVAPELQEKIKLVTSGGAGTVLPSQTGNANKYLKTDGTGLSWDALNGSDIDLSSPPAIGGTTPAAGTFTTLTATGQTSLGGVAGSESLRAIVAGTTGNYWQFEGSSGDVPLRLNGSSANINAAFITRGTGSFNFATGTSAATVQMRIAHTASAVNYVQVTGAATSNRPTISAQGSDASINMDISAKGFARMFFLVNGARNAEFTYGNQSAGVNGNHVKMFGNASGTAPVYSVEGTDTNIDLTLTPKGTGLVRFGTLTATADTAISGYITIKDSGGTTRKLAVIT